MSTMSTTQAARILGVSSQTIRRWIELGKLTGSKSDGKWQVELDSQHPLPNVATQTQRERTDVAIFMQQKEVEVAHLKRTNEKLLEEVGKLTQLLTVSQASIQQLTEQNQLLLKMTGGKISIPESEGLFNMLAPVSEGMG